MAATEVLPERISLICPLDPLADHGAASTSPSQEPRWNQLVDELLRLRRLPEDWDGQGASAPDAVNVHAALEWVQQMRCYPHAVPPSQVVPGTSGELMVVWQGVWHGQPSLLEAEIASPDQIEWLLAIGEETPRQWITPRGSFHFVGAIA